MQEPIIDKILKFSQANARVVLVCTLLITLFFAYFILRVKINPDIENLIPEDEKITKLMEKYGKSGESTDYLILAVESKDLFNIERLQAFDRAIQRVEALPHIKPAINPFGLITFRKNDKRLEIIPMSATSRAPTNQEELAQFKSNLLQDPFARRLVLSDDMTVLSSIFATEVMEDHNAFIASLNGIINDLNNYFKTYTTSLIQSTYRAKIYLLRDFPKLLGLTALFILAVYYFGFRAKRAIFLPSIVVGFGTIWCVGFMGLCGFPISVVSISTPPLVLILGSSYSIHMLNQYFREMKTIPASSSWIISAVSHVNKTILMAALTTVIGFGSLLATSMKQSREFGLSTSIGIIACALLSLFFLPAALSRLRPPTAIQRRKVIEGSLSRGMGAVSRLVLKWRVPFLILLGIIIVVFVLALPHIRHNAEYINYFPEGEKLVQDTFFITEKLGGFQQINLTLNAPGGTKNYFLNRDALEKISQFEDKLKENGNVYQVVSFVTNIKYLNHHMS
ncbi:MAG TPA: MMPL family transporter, partial [Spirochaetia bacterium]|nr:MMPL family transporter [Spirochaetia bacterium]